MEAKEINKHATLSQDKLDSKLRIPNLVPSLPASEPLQRFFERSLSPQPKTQKQASASLQSPFAANIQRNQPLLPVTIM